MKDKSKNNNVEKHLIEKEFNLTDFKIGSSPTLPPLNKRKDRYSITRRNCIKLLKAFNMI